MLNLSIVDILSLTLSPILWNMRARRAGFVNTNNDEATGNGASAVSGTSVENIGLDPITPLPTLDFRY